MIWSEIVIWSVSGSVTEFASVIVIWSALATASGIVFWFATASEFASESASEFASESEFVSVSELESVSVSVIWSELESVL